MPIDRKDHWETVSASKREHDVSWFEALPAISLRMIEAVG